MERVHGWTICMGLLAACVVSACALQRPAALTPGADTSARTALPAPTGLVQLLRYADRIRALPLATLQYEFTESEQQFVRDPSPDNRMRLAMLLTLPTAPFRNDARARDLLSGATGYPELARWLVVSIDERRALEEVAEEERRRRQALQAKLNQLKAIEEEMDRRMQPTVINPR